jgi:hypothetical protein
MKIIPKIILPGLAAFALGGCIAVPLPYTDGPGVYSSETYYSYPRRHYYYDRYHHRRYYRGRNYHVSVNGRRNDNYHAPVNGGGNGNYHVPVNGGGNGNIHVPVNGGGNYHAPVNGARSHVSPMITAPVNNYRPDSKNKMNRDKNEQSKSDSVQIMNVKHS